MHVPHGIDLITAPLHEVREYARGLYGEATALEAEGAYFVLTLPNGRTARAFSLGDLFLRAECLYSAPPIAPCPCGEACCGGCQ
jgi:hypothetical protein